MYLNQPPQIFVQRGKEVLFLVIEAIGFAEKDLFSA